MESVDHKAKRLIRYYERMAGSRDPVKIAEYANIRIAILPLGEIAGNYKLAGFSSMIISQRTARCLKLSWPTNLVMHFYIARKIALS